MAVRKIFLFPVFFTAGMIAGCGEQSLNLSSKGQKKQADEVEQPLFEYSRTTSTTFEQVPVETETTTPTPTAAAPKYISMNVRFIGSDQTSQQTNGGLYASMAVTTVVKNANGETFTLSKDVRKNLLNKKSLTLPELADGTYELEVMNAANRNILMQPNDNYIVVGIITVKDGQVTSTKARWVDSGQVDNVNGYSILYGAQNQCNLPVETTVVDDGIEIEVANGESPGCDQLESPLVVDLRNDAIASQGIKMSGPLDGVLFDIFGIGKRFQMGWIDASSIRNFGFIAKPNADGGITGIDNLFGDNTMGPDGRRASNGFQALAKYDSNRDGVINSRDAIYSQLHVWVDAIRNGRAERGELNHISRYGIASIDLRYMRMREVDEYGNRTLMRSAVSLADGSKRAIFDVWFRVLGGD